MANYPRETEFTDDGSDIFISRFGIIYNLGDFPDARTINRKGVFFVATAHNHILLNCPPWAQNWAEITGGGVKPDETVWESLSREIEEETKLKFQPNELEEQQPEQSIYYMNLYAEDLEDHPEKTPWLRYEQRFFFFQLDDRISVDELSKTSLGKDGSYAFWHPADKMHELPYRTDINEKISGLRVGHEHIIKQAINQL